MGTFLFNMHEDVYKYANLLAFLIKGTVSCIHGERSLFFFENEGFYDMIKTVYFMDLILIYKSALQNVLFACLQGSLGGMKRETFDIQSQWRSGRRCSEK